MKPFKIIKKKYLTNRTKYYMDDYNKNYKIDDLIFCGKVYEHNNFYAKIDNITPTSMNLTVLEQDNEGNNVIFYLTDVKYMGLTRRPFHLINKNT